VGILDQQTNVEIRNPLTLFFHPGSEEEIRPIAMYLTLLYLTKVRRDTKRRMLSSTRRGTF
jgi:hypothetical protein